MSRVALSLLLLALLASPLCAEDDAPEAHVFLEIVTPRDHVFVGEPFTLSLRVGIDRAFFDEHAVQLFRREMELPVQVEAPWLAGPPGTRALDRGGVRGDVPLAVEGREAQALRLGEQVRGDRRFEVVEVSGQYLPEVQGSHVLNASLRFGYATRFEEDFLGGRVAVDRRDVRVAAPPFTLTVDPLPEEGRLEPWAGVVGRYTVSASIAPASSAVDGALALTLRIEGRGNLAFVDAPAAVRIPGFHVYGLVDDHGAERRTIVYELAPLAGTTEIPAIPFVFFDPAPPAGYRVVQTDPIRLASPPSAPPPRDALPSGRGVTWAWLLAPIVLVLAALFFVRQRRRAAARRAAPPRATWSARLAADAADPTQLMTDALAAHLGVAPAAVIGPKLAARLQAAGVDVELAARAARCVEALVGARFGGGASARVERQEVAAVLEALDDVFAPAEDRG